MLNSLRRGAASWIVKAFLGVLVLSFVVWGVADVFRGYGSRTLATVGSKTISPEQLQQAFENELARLQARFGQRITREQARMFGLEQQALTRMIGDAALDNHAHDLGLGLSDSGVLEMIERDPTFQSNGAFSRETFSAVLRANGLSEATFFERQRGALVRNQIIEALVADAAVPSVAVEAMNRYREETRTLSYIVLPYAKAGTPAEPEEEKLKAFHEANKRRFSTPELRKLALVTLTPEAMAKPETVTEADLKTAFEERKAKFGSPEKRTLQQLTFPDLAAAEKGLAELKAGKDFMALGKELGLKETDINLGRLAKAEMIDKALAEAAFALKKDELSAPIQGPFSVVVARAVEIIPAVVKTLDEVSGELRGALALEKAVDDVQTLRDKIDNARGKGANLKEAAERAGLKIVEIGPLDREGKGADGKPAEGLPEPARVMAKVFETDVGAEADAVDLSSGGVAWFDVQGITPEALKPLDSIREEVKKAWAEAEVRKLAQETAQKLSDRLNKGEALEALAKELDLTVTTTSAIKRSDKAEPLTPAAVSLGFSMPAGTAGHTEGSDNASRVILKVATVQAPAAPDKAKSDAFAGDIKRQLVDDLAGQYMEAIKTRYGVKINQDVLRRALGQTDQ